MKTFKVLKAQLNAKRMITALNHQYRIASIKKRNHTTLIEKKRIKTVLIAVDEINPVAEVKLVKNHPRKTNIVVEMEKNQDTLFYLNIFLIYLLEIFVNDIN